MRITTWGFSGVLYMVMIFRGSPVNTETLRFRVGPKVNMVNSS